MKSDLNTVKTLNLMIKSRENYKSHDILPREYIQVKKTNPENINKDLARFKYKRSCLHLIKVEHLTLPHLKFKTQALHSPDFLPT